jgi:hypothetical protein
MQSKSESDAPPDRLLSRLDAFLSSSWWRVAGFSWGFAEATFFFIVPDVFLTLTALRSLRRSVTGTFLALAGALAGGAMMYALGLRSPGSARWFLDHIPGISPNLIATVEAQVSADGLTAILFGPARGIPYKILAVEWGARAGDFAAFMLISIPARYVRFFLTAVGANFAVRLFAPLTGKKPAVELTLFVLFWCAFYSFYFLTFGF